MNKKLVAGLIAFLLVAAVGVGLWYSRGSEDKNQLLLHGNIDIRQISLAFDGSGRVTELRVEEGDNVKAGDIIGLLDTRTLALQAEQAKAKIEVQQQTLLRMRNGSRPQEVAQARSRLNSAQADASRANQDLARLDEISKSTQGRAVSPQDMDRAKSNAQIAKAKLDEQREGLRLTELGPRTEEVSAAEAQLKAAQAELAFQLHLIAQGELKAPADAVVRSRLLEPGDMATPQRPVFALALTRPKWVRVYVNETDLGKVRPGMTAHVVTDSHPDQPQDGKVGYISSTAEFTPKSVQTEELRTSLVYELRVLIEDKNNVLRLGQPATVRIVTSEKQ